MGRKRRPHVDLSSSGPARSTDFDELFTSGRGIEQSAGMTLLAIQLDAIEPDPLQPRQSFSAESIEELSDSIRENGVIQPIEVVQVAQHSYRIIHGERRWRAAQQAGLDTIPAIVQRRDYDDVTRFVRQLVENIQREDLNDVDRAAGLVRLRELMQDELNAEAEAKGDKPWGSKVTWAKVGSRMGLSRQRIHQLIQLLRLPEEIREAVRGGTLSERDARMYQGLEYEQQAELFQAVAQGKVTAQEAKKVSTQIKRGQAKSVDAAIRAVQSGELPKTKQKPPRSALIDRGNQSRLEQAQALLAHVRLTGLDSAEANVTYRLLQDIADQVDKMLRTL
jgi:ParB family chromosome partitioning protein